jgi:hypothetical protein
MLVKKIWRTLPLRYRGKILGKVKSTSLGQRALRLAGSGVYSKEVLDSGLVFIHVPKVAGTSVVKGLYGIDGIGHFTAEEVCKGLGRRRQEVELIALTRCPWERAISIYEFVKGGGTDKVPFINSAGLKIPSSFQDFAQKFLSEHTEEQLSDVFKTQCNFICNKQNKLIVDKVFKLVELDRMKVYAERKMQEDVDIPFFNTTSRNKKLYEYYSDDETLKGVENFYHRDIKNLGYIRPF